MITAAAGGAARPHRRSSTRTRSAPRSWRALLRTAGHRVTVVRARAPHRAERRRLLARPAPRVALARRTRRWPSVVKGVRQALGGDVRILVLYGFDPQGAPSDVDDVQRAEPLQPTELQIRVSRLLRELAERRDPAEEDERAPRPLQDVLGLLAGRWRRRALRPPLAPQRRDAEGRARARAALRRASGASWWARRPASASPRSRCSGCATRSTARRDSRWNFRKNGPAALEQGPGGHPAPARARGRARRCSR